MILSNKPVKRLRILGSLQLLITVIMPLGSSSFIGAASGEKGGVNNLAFTNIPINKAFPAIPKKIQ
jgi:hypothetical protein